MTNNNKEVCNFTNKVRPLPKSITNREGKPKRTNKYDVT